MLSRSRICPTTSPSPSRLSPPSRRTLPTARVAPSSLRKRRPQPPRASVHTALPSALTFRAHSRYAELVAAHDAAQEALAESTSKIDNLSGEFESTAAARDNFEAQATACQSDRLSLQQQLAFVQRQLDSTSKEQKDRVTSLNAEIEEMARCAVGPRT